MSGIRPAALESASFGMLRDLLSGAALALVAAGADRATAQVVAPGGSLVLVAHERFPSGFVDHFATVEIDDGCACGQAASHGGPVVVSDVATGSVFAGSPSREIMLETGSRAVTSFPVVGQGGVLVGIVSAHYATSGDHAVAPGSRVVAQVERDLARIPRPSPHIAELRRLEAENTNLHRALETRDVIATAKGILMARSDIGSDAAFRMLVAASQRENVKLHVIAARLVAAHDGGPDERGR